MNRAYRVLEQLLRIVLLGALWLVMRAIPRERRREGGRRNLVVIVQFAPRPGFVGGDVVANELIADSLKKSGYQVETVSVSPDEPRNPALDWLFEEKWKVYRAAMRKIPVRGATLIVDAQLNIGFYRYPCVNIFHYSHFGYLKLAGQGWALANRLGSAASSILQSMGGRRSLNVAVSPFQARFLKKEWIKVDRIIPNSVDTELFKPVDGLEKTGDFLYVGGYNYRAKGFDVLEALAERGLRIDCVTNHSTGGGLKYLGSLPHAMIPRALRGHKVLIHPSRYESCSMCVLEAMASGLPVLISNVGIGPELRKEIPEFVVEGFDDSAIDEYLRKSRVLLGDYSRYSRLARDYIERNHSYARFQEEWAELFKRKRNGH